MKSLLEEAQSLPHKRRTLIPFGDEDVAIALAWLDGSVTYSQLTCAYVKKGILKSEGNSYGRIAIALKKAFSEGTLRKA